MAQNTVFILTDQWPAWAFGFLGADIPTPNIDRLSSRRHGIHKCFHNLSPLHTCSGHTAHGSLAASKWRLRQPIRRLFPPGIHATPSKNLD